MAGWATDGAIRPGPEWSVDKLGKQISRIRRSIGQMLGDQLPAVVVGCHQVWFWAIEERDVLQIPVPVAIIEIGLIFEQRLLV